MIGKTTITPKENKTFTFLPTSETKLESCVICEPQKQWTQDVSINFNLGAVNGTLFKSI